MGSLIFYELQRLYSSQWNKGRGLELSGRGLLNIYMLEGYISLNLVSIKKP
jgi:hypothetical protein